MSYEGYEVWYCGNGHRIASFGAFDSPGMWDENDKGPRCQFCDSQEVHIDHVDQTNGCFCDELEEEETCPCHESVRNIAGYTEVPCDDCFGTQVVEQVAEYLDEPCSCKSDPACEECHGTGTRRVPCSWVEVDCRKCLGTGKTYEPKWDLTPLFEYQKNLNES